MVFVRLPTSITIRLIAIVKFILCFPSLFTRDITSLSFTITEPLLFEQLLYFTEFFSSFYTRITRIVIFSEISFSQFDFLHLVFVKDNI